MLIAVKGWVLAMLAFPKPEKLRVAPVPAKRPPLTSIPLVSDAGGMGRAEERAAFQADQGTGLRGGSRSGRVGKPGVDQVLTQRSGFPHVPPQLGFRAVQQRIGRSQLFAGRAVRQRAVEQARTRRPDRAFAEPAVHRGSLPQRRRDGERVKRLGEGGSGTG